jgi:uncharacterized protein YcbX
MGSGGLSVRALHIYPVKSCRGLALEEAVLEKRGLRHDRRWMVVDEERQFLTQRTDPRLALVGVTIEGEELRLAAAGHGEVRLVTSHVPQRGTERTRVRVWKDEVEAADGGAEAAAWMTAWLGRPARLVSLPDDSVRTVNPKYANEGDEVAFADGFPLLIVTTASLADLNAKLKEPIPMDRFRPNVVVDGGEAWAEDAWKRIRIGTVSVRVAKPCARCVVTTTDQQTGARGVEPLRTLATFRSSRDSRGEMFGQNAIPDGEGILRVGDTVTIDEELAPS